MPWIGRLLLGTGATVGAAWWLTRQNQSALPYSMRIFLKTPRPMFGRDRLREVLDPAPGDRVLEIGPGTGLYTVGLADWVGTDGTVEIFDIQQEYLDHTMRAVAERGFGNVVPTRGDAQSLPYKDDSFDAVVLITVFGEIPDGDAALREITRVLKPEGRLVVGETIFDPDYISFGSLRRRAIAAGLRPGQRWGPAIAYFAELAKPEGTPR